MSPYPNSGDLYIGLGTNLPAEASLDMAEGERISKLLEQLRSCLEKFDCSEHFGLLQVSSVYRSMALGPAQADYLNLVFLTHTELKPHELLKLTQSFEVELGRKSSNIRWGPRAIDIDILCYGKYELRDSQLTIPHPEISKRAFVLEPWNELSPKLILPGFHEDIQGLLQKLNQLEPIQGSILEKLQI